MLYLAYGSNMFSEQMKDRCPSAKVVGAGYLEGYKLVFDGHSKIRCGMVADIRKKIGARTPYVLWEITNEKDLQKLDKREGYYGTNNERNRYEKEKVSVICRDNKIEATIYVMTKRNKGSRESNPIVSLEYEDTIRQGLMEHGLNSSYLDNALKEAKHRLN